MASPKLFSSLYLTSHWSRLLFAVYKPRYNAEYYRRLLAYEDDLKVSIARRGELSLLPGLNGLREDISEMIRLNKIGDTTIEDKQKFLAQEEKLMPRILTMPNRIHESVGDTESAIDVIKPRSASTMPVKMLDYIKLSYINGCMYKSVVGPNSQYYFGIGAKLQLAIMDYFLDKLETELDFDHFSGLCIVKSAVVEAVNSYDDKTFQEDCCRIVKDASATQDGVADHLVEISRESCAAFISRCRLNTSIITSLRLMCSGASYHSGQESYEKQLVKQSDIVYCMSLTSSKEKDSSVEFSALKKLIWDCYKELALPSRLVHCGARQLRSNEYDSYRVDTWLPSKSAWLPVARVSNYLDYITTRISLKRGHIIDATAVDSNVLVMSIIENNQDALGKFKIPECLKKHVIGLTEAEERNYFKSSVSESLFQTSSASHTLNNYTPKRHFMRPSRVLFSHSKRFQKNRHPPYFFQFLFIISIMFYGIFVDKRKFYDNLPVAIQRFLYNYILRLVIRPIMWFFDEPVENRRPVNDYYDDYVKLQNDIKKGKELMLDAAKKRRVGLSDSD